MYLYPRERCNSRWDTGTAAEAADGQLLCRRNLCILCLGSKEVHQQSFNSDLQCPLFSDLLVFTPVVKNTDIEVGKPAV